jgi:uncharacterized membrane protein YphA (DoxX/SURF4 family)
MKWLLRILRIIVGLLFIFSGVVKANDPLGLCYKMQEFFLALHINFLSGIALPLSIVMIAFEIMAGIAVLLGYGMRLFGTLLLLLIILFTFLTAYAYFSGKILECGCFGDCIKISDAASFWKDVLLLLMILVIFAYRKKIKPVFKKGTGFLMFIGIVFSFGLQWYTLNHLPIVDCLPYAVGKNIPSEMKPPANAVPDKYAIVMTYEKDGVQKEFTMDNYPWQDTSWHFVKREEKLIRKGDEIPLVQDFVITDFSGNDSTYAILHNPRYVFLFFVNHVDEAGKGWGAKMKQLEDRCLQYHITLYGITASDSSLVSKFSQQHGLNFPFLQMDATIIKTIARSNPCLLLLQDGTVKGKWHYHDIPSWQTLTKKYLH